MARFTQNPASPHGSARAVGEMIDLQRRIFERQREIIEAGEFHATPGFQRYRRAYRRATADYESESGFGALCDAIAASRVAFVADYHTLNLAQRTFVKLVRGVMSQVDSLCLALEFVREEYQDELDRYLAGWISERSFLRRIRYLESWPYDIWPSFKPIFELATEQGFPVVAIDSDSSLALPKRDQRAARRIADAALHYPDATILVFIGQMHVAPPHLPKSVEREFAARGLAKPEHAIVYQNAEEIYWQLAAARREGVEVVKIDHESFCVNNTPPLVQQLSYLHWVQYDQDLLEYSEMERTVRSLIQSLDQFLGLGASEAAEQLRVLMPGDLDLFDALTAGGLPSEEIAAVMDQVESEESACIPALNLIYLATLSVNHAAEEAAHYLKHLASRGQEPEDLRDRFYYAVLHEACAFFGSKVINPKRKTDHPGRLRRNVAQARQRGDSGPEEQAAEVALQLLAAEHGDKTHSAIAKAKALAVPAVFNATAHILGYILGDRLYYGLTGGALPKTALRDLFLARLDSKGEALDAYLELTRALRAVKIPRRI